MKTIMFAAALLWATSAMSADRWHTSTIKHIYPQSDGSFILIFDTSDAYCPSVESSKYYTVSAGQVGVTAEGEKKIYAAALLAHSMGKPIQVLYNDSTANCFVKRLLTM